MSVLPGFTGLAIDLDIQDGAWGQHITDSATLKHGRIERVGNLPNGTSKGLPAFQLLATLDDGSQVIVETTWALIYTAVRGLAAKWGEPDGSHK